MFTRELEALSGCLLEIHVYRAEAS